MKLVATSDRAAFAAAGKVLADFVKHERAPRTQNFSVAIAALLAKARPGSSVLPISLHVPGRGAGLTTKQLQVDVCDFVFEKIAEFRPAVEKPIYKPFSNGFYARSPSANNWRNSFDLQAGISCDAPYGAEFLRSPVYLAEPRSICSFRNAVNGHCTSPAGLLGTRTCFNPSKRNEGLVPGPDSNARPAAKLLTRAQQKGEAAYWIVEPSLEVLTDLLGHPSVRVPLYPFMAGLYCGSSALMEGRPYVSLQLMQSDLGIADEQFVAVFDPNMENVWNRQFFDSVQQTPTVYDVIVDSEHGSESDSINNANVLPKHGKAKRGTSLDALNPKFSDDNKAIRPYSAGSETQYRMRANNSGDPDQRLRLLEKAAHGHARALCILAAISRNAGFSPLEQSAGFDLLVRGVGVDYLFEVKTWRSENVAAQIRAGIAQLYEYRWRNRYYLSEDCRMYLVFDRSPVDELSSLPWIKEYLSIDRKIVPCWIDGDRLETFPDLLDQLAWLLES